jgi:predicted membrane-bound mannosyltransferase
MADDSMARGGLLERSWAFRTIVVVATALGAALRLYGLDNIAQWQALGVSERAARLGACWVGIATVPILGFLTRTVAGASALLLAITPWHLYWSQMARFYTAKFLFTSVFILLFARGMQTGRKSCFAIASAAVLLAYFSHPTAIFVLGACIAGLGIAWIARAPLPHLGPA